MSQSHDYYSHGHDKTGLSPTLLHKCQTDFDEFVGKFRYVDDLINNVSNRESLYPESLFGDLYDIAVNKYGSDGDELEFSGAAFIDGAVLAMAAADILAANMGIDPMAYRVQFRHLLDSSSKDEAVAANFEPHVQVHEAFQVTYETIHEVTLDSTTEDIDSFHDGFESTLTLAAQSIFIAKALGELAPIEDVLNDEELFNKALAKLQQPRRVEVTESTDFSELIPEEFSKLFDPLADVNAAIISDYMLGRLFSAESVAKEIKYLHQFQTQARPRLVERLINIGKYVESYNDELECSDSEYTRMNSFNSGMTIALSLIDIISLEVRGSRSEWGAQWVALSSGYDSPSMLLEKTPETAAECSRVGISIIEIGNKLWDKLPSEFQEMIKTIEGQLKSTSTHINIFRASFAYVFFFGREVLAQVTLDENEDEYIEGMMPLDKYFEDERKFFFNT